MSPTRVRVVVSYCQSAGGGRSVGNDGSCPVLKVAPVGRNARVAAVVMKQSLEGWGWRSNLGITLSLQIENKAESKKQNIVRERQTHWAVSAVCYWVYAVSFMCEEICRKICGQLSEISSSCFTTFTKTTHILIYYQTTKYFTMEMKHWLYYLLLTQTNYSSQRRT